LSYAALARALRLSPSQVSRLYRREGTDVGVVRVAELLGGVGLELSARAFPAGPPVRDAPSQSLLERFRSRLGTDCRCRTEVPVLELATPGAVDLRAWDLAVDGPGWSIRVDAETRLADVQAVQRRVALKQRDGRIEQVVLLVSDTAHNRAALRLAHDALTEQFPISTRAALARLSRGLPPGGNALVVL
jgi:hypothetical protein